MVLVHCIVMVNKGDLLLQKASILSLLIHILFAIFLSLKNVSYLDDYNEDFNSALLPERYLYILLFHG